jgi:hypothetical protein
MSGRHKNVDSCFDSLPGTAIPHSAGAQLLHKSQSLPVSLHQAANCRAPDFSAIPKGETNEQSTGSSNE